MTNLALHWSQMNVSIYFTKDSSPRPYINLTFVLSFIVDVPLNDVQNIYVFIQTIKKNKEYGDPNTRHQLIYKDIP